MHDRFEIVARRKALLLRLARMGFPRPSQIAKVLKWRRLGWSLSNYTVSSSGAFDKEFSKKIRALRPDWFGIEWSVLRRIRNREKVRKMIETKKIVAPKDRAIFRRYTNFNPRVNSDDLAIMARELSPELIYDPQRNRNKFLENLHVHMATTVERPDDWERTRAFLNTDPFIKTKVKALRPEWYVSHQWMQWQDELMRIALAGGERPGPHTHLGRYLTHCGGRYHHFRKTLRSLRPDWFYQIRSAPGIISDSHSHRNGSA